jgi:hypothetical protein
MKVNNEALHTPLLGDDLADNSDDEESFSQQVAHEKQDDDNDKNGTGPRAHRHIGWDFVFLLLIQCRMTLSIVTTPALSATYTLQFISTSIVTFGLSIWLYRLSCPDFPKNIVKNRFLLLLPEVAAIIVMFILFILGEMGAAMVALHAGSLLLSAVALAGTLHCLLCCAEQEDDEGEEDMEASRLQVGTLNV